MKMLKINFENCYGIGTLKKEFDFSEKNLYIIYAPNGSMKTSFANTFQDLSNAKLSEDRIFKNRATKRDIKNENNVDINKEQIFVIEPYNESFRSSKISTLLVNKKLKDKYDQIYKDIDERKELLIKAVRLSSGLKKDLEEIFSNDIVDDPKEFYKALLVLKENALDVKQNIHGDIAYSKIFNDKTIPILESAELREKLLDYINVYDDLIGSSTFFKKGVFNHNNAAEISKNLKDNGFFKANHSVIINLKDKKKEIKTEADLEKTIQEEKDGILKDPALAKAFEEIDKRLIKNKELKEFRECLNENKSIIIELKNIKEFKRKLWIAYLANNIDLYKSLLDCYSEGKEEIEKIVLQAKKEETKWKNIIEIFNERFLVPFVVSMENQHDVILKREAPSIKFRFKDFKNDTDIPIEERDLWPVLSNGERRALYILNIIFEVEARREDRQETIFIVDDIADSFDYKNKYAIIEYLSDVAKEELFYQIILTHNFDFFRNISSRLAISGKYKLHVTKNKLDIKMIEEKYSINPFKKWKENLTSSEEMFIASIPFLRNLAEYCGFPTHKDTLTKLLHLKTDTDKITVGDVEKIIKDILQDKKDIEFPNKDKIVIERLHEIAKYICEQADEVVDLEKKILLSIAIRLEMEKYLIDRIDDYTFVNGIQRNQTIVLIRKFKEKCPKENDAIKLAERVNLMTPENIHINSFMYEPILDMASDHLKQLYKNVCNMGEKASLQP